MDAFAKEALSRLPLAEAVMRCWQWAMNGPALQGIFDRCRGRSYEGVLTFETIVHLTANALLLCKHYLFRFRLCQQRPGSITRRRLTVRRCPGPSWGGKIGSTQTMILSSAEL